MHSHRSGRRREGVITSRTAARLSPPRLPPWRGNCPDPPAGGLSATSRSQSLARAAQNLPPVGGGKPPQARSPRRGSPDLRVHVQEPRRVIKEEQRVLRHREPPAGRERPDVVHLALRGRRPPRPRATDLVCITVRRSARGAERDLHTCARRASFPVVGLEGRRQLPLRVVSAQSPRATELLKRGE